VGEHTSEAAASIRAICGDDLPDVAYLPHPDEWHPDHKAALPILHALSASVPGFAPHALGYEVWTPLPEAPDLKNISPVIIRKMRAVRCYPSQLQSFRYDRAIRGLNQYRGVMAGGCAYAEAFITIESKEAS